MKYLVCAYALFFFFKTTENITTSKTNQTPTDFEIFTSQNRSVILYDKSGGALDSIAAHLLASDIFKITDYQPKVVTNIKQAQGHVIVIGHVNSKLIKLFLNNKVLQPAFKNQWESYAYHTIINPSKKIKKAFVICGTHARGTAYGVFNISKKIGINPWYWWADVPVKKKKTLILNQANYFSKPPSVKYRGIFLNDEDWGLQPWAAKTFEPETDDIGPKTYAKIFELLLRLNANTIWPAMHPSTKAFFYYPGNTKMAKHYQMVIGTSHAEPMLRNNVDEWDKKKFGAFNYKTNKNNVHKYWETRVAEAKNIDAIYSMGMRGVHDSGMEGVKSKDEAVQVLNQVITDQRNLLKKHINPNVEQVPQALTVYKEVLDLYKNGLVVPDDMTLVWTDDNYGYIRALSNAEEQKRAGGGGVYYHASYWGRPHDYLWLSTTNPQLIREEMMKAYNLNNNNIWILNVGDIKPAEYNTQLFLDIAYNADKFQDSEYINTHQNQFYREIFGNAYADKITAIRNQYFQLAFERKPEFMGWSQTEKTTPIYNTAYSTFSFGDEIEKRITAYQNLETQTLAIQNQLPENLQSSFFQLVGYPVLGASNINKKFLFRDKALAYAEQGRKSALAYKERSNQAYKNIAILTKEYNSLSSGKWNGMMDMKPRRLPVFDNPEIKLSTVNSDEVIGISIENDIKNSKLFTSLPTFYIDDSATYFIDIFLKKTNSANWKINKLPNWIKATKTSGKLNVSNSTLEERIYISIDWKVWKNAGEPSTAIFNIESNSEEKELQVNVSKNYKNVSKNSFVEKNGMAVFYANHYSKNEKKSNKNWQEIIGFGHSESVMQASPLHAVSSLNFKDSPVLEYEIYTETLTKEAALSLVAIPSHPTTTDGNLRIAVQWNNEPVEVINFKTVGRSTTWKQNVLSNKAIKKIQVPLKKKGLQKLKIYMVDTGVLLDYFMLNTNQYKNPYSLPLETKVD